MATENGSLNPKLVVIQELELVVIQELELVLKGEVHQLEAAEEESEAPVNQDMMSD